MDEDKFLNYWLAFVFVLSTVMIIVMLVLTVLGSIWLYQQIL